MFQVYTLEGFSSYFIYYWCDFSVFCVNWSFMSHSGPWLEDLILVLSLSWHNTFATQNTGHLTGMYLLFTLLLCLWLLPLLLPSEGNMYWCCITALYFIKITCDDDTKTVCVLQIKEKKYKSIGHWRWGLTGGGVIFIDDLKFIMILMCFWIKTVLKKPQKTRLLVALQSCSANLVS